MRNNRETFPARRDVLLQSGIVSKLYDLCGNAQKPDVRKHVLRNDA